MTITSMFNFFFERKKIPYLKVKILCPKQQINIYTVEKIKNNFVTNYSFNNKYIL
jgi:hypothetical protein